MFKCDGCGCTEMPTHEHHTTNGDHTTHLCDFCGEEILYMQVSRTGEEIDERILNIIKHKGDRK